MDLAKLSLRTAASAGAVLHLKDPVTGEPLFDGDKPVTITVRGVESQELREKARDIERRKLGGEKLDDAQIGAEKLASITADWSGIALHGPDPLACTFENAVRLYLDADAEWIVEQVGPFSRDRRNFVKNRPTG